MASSYSEGLKTYGFSALSAEEEYNQNLTLSKRNRRICLERLPKHNDSMYDIDTYLAII
jgi:hypothetical protein